MFSCYYYCCYYSFRNILYSRKSWGEPRQIGLVYPVIFVSCNRRNNLLHFDQEKIKNRGNLNFCYLTRFFNSSISFFN